MKIVLGVMRSEMALDSGSKKWNRCLMRGLSMDSPRTVLGLLKKFVLMVGLKFVHVFCLHVIARIE